MINAAIVGLGRWGRNHVNAVAGSSRIRYVRAVTRNPAAAQDFAAQHDLALTTRFEEVLADPAIDAVVLATPHSQHVDEVVAAAKAGKAVWCEKPLALDPRRGGARGRGLPRRRRDARERLQPALLLLDARARARGEKRRARRHPPHRRHFSNEYSIHVIGGGWRDDPTNSPRSA